MPTRPVISQVMPVSSRVSRTAVSVIDSPGSMPPPGTAQLPLSVRRMSRISPWLLTTMTFADGTIDRKSTRLNSSHQIISYAVFCLKKKNSETHTYSKTPDDYTTGERDRLG